MTREIEDQRRAIDLHNQQADFFRQRYQRFRRDPYSSAFAYTRRRMFNLLDRYLPHEGVGLKLLDAGCGSGYALQTYSERGFECAGVDAAEAMVDQARMLNPSLDVRLGDISTLPFESGTFDVILCMEVVRYLPNPRPAFSEFYRVLRTGGIAFVTATPPLTLTGYPTFNWLLTSRFQLGRFARVRHFFHSAGRLERQLREVGFSNLETVALFSTSLFWGPLVALEGGIGRGVAPLLRAWEPVDEWLSSFRRLRNFSNHLIAIASK
jgi:SAM-dependent methyltransferase